jgi:thymidylate synthase (FAD)
MPKSINIEIFNTVKSQVNREEVKRWMDFIGANEFEIPENQVVTDPALCIALAAKRCYMSFQPGLNPNVNKVRKNYTDYFDNILESGHGSVLEHSSFTFAIEGVSRVFTAEMNRHRAGWAISEGSLRYIRFDKNIPFWMPTCFQVDENDDTDLKVKKELSREIFHSAFSYQEQFYGELMNIWDMNENDKNFHYKKTVTSACRRIIGMGVATGGVWTGNVRALRHVIAMRTNKEAAEEEIYYVFCKIAKYLIENEPMLFGDFKFTNNSYVPDNWKV